jgi:hypothetical protein
MNGNIKFIGFYETNEDPNPEFGEDTYRFEYYEEEPPERQVIVVDYKNGKQPILINLVKTVEFDEYKTIEQANEYMDENIDISNIEQ